MKTRFSLILMAFIGAAILSAGPTYRGYKPTPAPISYLYSREDVIGQYRRLAAAAVKEQQKYRDLAGIIRQSDPRLADLAENAVHTLEVMEITYSQCADILALRKDGTRRDER